jgi:hypothetical protein
MRYLLVIWGNDEDWTQAPMEQIQAAMAAHTAFGEELRKANAYVAAEALQISANTTTIRVQDGEPLITDGPYMETKEQVGGFYMVDSDDLDQVLEWAKQLAEFNGGVIEVRPVVPTG